jgi:hypothetical protein
MFIWLAFMWTSREVYKLIWIGMVVWALTIIWQEHTAHQERSNKANVQKAAMELIASGQTNFVDNVVSP